MSQPPHAQAGNVQALSDQMNGTMAVLRWMLEAVGSSQDDERGRALNGHLETAVSSVSDALRLLGSDPEAFQAPKHTVGTHKGSRRERKRATEKARNLRLRERTKRPDSGSRSDGEDEPETSVDLVGSTRCFAIPEVLGLVSSLRKSGVFRVSNEWENFLLEFDEGRVVFAHGDSPPDGLLLGEILVAQGALTEAALDDFFTRRKGEVDILGVTLVREGLVTEEQLRRAVAFQVQHVVHRMYGSRSATFEFQEGDSVRKEHKDVQLDVTRLLLESARTLDESQAQVDAALAWLDGDDDEEIDLIDSSPDLAWFNQD